MSDSDVEVPSSTRRRVVRGLVSIAVVLAIFIGVLPRVADLSDVWAEISAMTGLEVVSLLLLASWNLATYTFVYMASLPGLRASQGFIVTEASTAIANTVPGGAGFGIGVTWAMFSSWGFRRPEIALSVLVTGVWNIFAKLGLPVLALALVAFEGESTAGSAAAPSAWRRAPCGWWDGRRSRGGRRRRASSGPRPTSCCGRGGSR